MSGAEVQAAGHYRLRATLGIAGMAVVALFALLPLAGAGSVTHVDGLQWWMLVPAAAVAEIFVVHLFTAHSAHTLSLREVPSVLALAFLSPLGYLAAHVLGAGGAIVLHSRQRGIKLAFNLVLFALEVALGVVVYRALAGDAAAEPRAWLAASVAVLVTDLVGAICVTGIIWIVEGVLDGQVLKEALTRGAAAALANTSLALLVVVLTVREIRAVPLLGVVVTVLFLGYRGYHSLSRRQRQLKALYGFLGSVSETDSSDHAVSTVLDQARRLLQAERAELVVPGRSRRWQRTVADRGGLRAVESDETGAEDSWWLPATFGQQVQRSPASSGSGQPKSSAAWDGLAVPLPGPQAGSVLIVAERSFEGDTFGAEDLALLVGLAEHAGVALSNAALLERMQGLIRQREYEARHDSLTGLPNRIALLDRLEDALTSGQRGAVVLIDLDDFRTVNDTLGHTAGDSLLMKVGQRLTESGAQLSETCAAVARVGGDEFAVLLISTEELTDERAAAAATCLVSALARPLTAGDVSALVTGGAGVAVLGRHGDKPDVLLARADVAMYAAKAAGTGVETYDAQGESARHRRLALAVDLSTRVDAGAFDISYQPQCRAYDSAVVSVEALLRWRHPAFGSVDPSEVVAIAERIGTMRRLTDAVLLRALEQRWQWAQDGVELGMSVNVSALDLHDLALPDMVETALARTATPPGELTVEITESGIMRDPARCLQVLDRLSALGVRLSVDDFGTGYSSLAYLERLPVNEVKIDRSFIQRMQIRAGDATVVRATVALAHDLGMSVVAEGVETTAVRDALVDLDVDLLQGYWLGRPMAADDLAQWLGAPRSAALTSP